MERYGYESSFSEHITGHPTTLSDYSLSPSRNELSADRQEILQELLRALQRLHHTLFDHQSELLSTAGFLECIAGLQRSLAQGLTKDQFRYLTCIRMWLFWVPDTLLRGQGRGRGKAMVTIAHFYAAALSLDSVFPNLGLSFCTAPALSALQAIFREEGEREPQHHFDFNGDTWLYPRDVAQAHSVHKDPAQ